MRFSRLNGVILSEMPYIYSGKPQPSGQYNHRDRRQGPENCEAKGQRMGRLIKILLVLIVIGFAALTGYAYLVEMTPPQSEIRQPVMLNAN